MSSYQGIDHENDIKAFSSDVTVIVVVAAAVNRILLQLFISDINEVLFRTRYEWKMLVRKCYLQHQNHHDEVYDVVDDDDDDNVNL